MLFPKTVNVVVIIASLFVPSIVWSQELTPFATSNQSPLVAIYGLPATMPATVLPDQATELTFRTDIASLSSRSSNGDERIELDGETYRLTLAARRGIGNDFEVGMEIPYVMHREGFLDNFIKNWHDFFGLPQGERDDQPEDRLLYDYRNNGTALSLDQEEGGFGDLRLTGGWQFWNSHDSHLALRTSLKLPTGDTDKLLGSGSTDLAIWLSAENLQRQGSVGLFGSIGLLLMTDGDVLDHQHRNVAGFGSLGSAWQAFDRVAFKIQIDGHTAMYEDSRLDELGASAQLVMGGTLELGDATSLDLGVSEDIIVDSAPDVVFHLALRTRF